MIRLVQGKYAAIALLCLLFIQASAIAQPQSLQQSASQAESLPLHWGFVHFPPFYYLNEDGTAAGVLAELVAEVMASIERDYSYSQYPNRRMIHLLNEGELDIAVVMTSVLENKNLYRISQQPVSSMQLSAFWLGEKPTVHRIGDLYDSRVIVMSGFSYGGMRPMLEPGYGVVREVIEVGQHALGIEALRLNRGDYLLNYKETATLSVLDNTLPSIQHSVLSKINVYFLLRADLPDSEQLMQQIEAALAAIRDREG